MPNLRHPDTMWAQEQYANQFDPLAAIETLAKTEWPCSDRGEDVATNDKGIHTEFGYRRFQDKLHELCGGTGRIVPFKELRLKCLICWCQDGHKTCDCCGGHGWVSEPDVEKACWRTEGVRIQHGGEPVFLAPDGLWYAPQDYEHGYSTREEAELRAALAWAQEQQKEAQDADN